jgi:hypothetical protein
MRQKNKDGRYVIDETNILPDLLEKTEVYVNRNTKEIEEMSVYDLFLRNDRKDLVKVKNKKAVNILFNSNRQKLPRGT